MRLGIYGKGIVNTGHHCSRHKRDGVKELHFILSQYLCVKSFRFHITRENGFESSRTIDVSY
jgi:hypothetical protein